MNNLMVLYAYAASDALWGASIAYATAAGNQDNPVMKRVYRAQALRLQVQSLIQFDRAITQDARGIKRILPSLNCGA